MEECVTSNKLLSLPYSMILTRVFKFYNVDFANESADVTATMESCMAKDNKKKSKIRLIDTDTDDFSSMSVSPSPPAAKETWF